MWETGPTVNLNSRETFRSSVVRNSLARSIIRPCGRTVRRRYWALLVREMAGEKMARGDGSQNTSALAVWLHPVSQHRFPTKKIILDRNYLYGVFKLLLIAANYPLRASLSKI